MIDITVIATAAHQVACGEAVLAGIRSVGGRGRISRSERHATKHVCCWGWRAGQRLRANGHEVLVMERGYMGDRFKWFSLGWNGLNGRATFPEFQGDGGARFGEHFGGLLKPWKEGGDYVLLIGQVPGDMSLQGKDLRPWYDEAAFRAQSAYEMPVRFREHPVAVRRGFQARPRYAQPIGGDLAGALAGAYACVTFNSNTAVEAVLAGVPTTAIDQGSMAWDVTAHRVGDIARPSREAWAHRLAHRQWLIEEIAAGAPFQHLKETAC